jgi:hypothetical protein
MFCTAKYKKAVRLENMAVQRDDFSQLEFSQSDAPESESRNGRKRVTVVPGRFRHDDNDENDHSQRKKSKLAADDVSGKRLMTVVRGAKEKESVDLKKLPAPPTPVFDCMSSPSTSRLPQQALTPWSSSSSEYSCSSGKHYSAL